MSETLRDLVVSLSLQTDNFTRNIKSVNKQIQEAESKFRLAAAGIEGFEKTATGLSTQLSTLERRLQLQRDAVTQYEKALTAANTKLQECYNRQNDYAQRLTDAKTAQQALKEQVGLAAQQYRTNAYMRAKFTAASIFRSKCPLGTSISVHSISIAWRCSAFFFSIFITCPWYSKKGRIMRLFLTA